MEQLNFNNLGQWTLEKSNGDPEFTEPTQETAEHFSRKADEVSEIARKAGDALGARGEDHESALKAASAHTLAANHHDALGNTEKANAHLEHARRWRNEARLRENNKNAGKRGLF